MTAIPVPPNHLLTIAEYAALGEVESGYTELLEGRLQMSPSPTPDHTFASVALVSQLLPQVPDGVLVLPDIDVDLELAPTRQPGFSRRPDLVLVEQDALFRVRAEGGLFRASEVLLIAEIVSPGSRRIDNVIKFGEYADAGIPHYWIIDIVPPVSLMACHLVGEFGYQQGTAVTSEFTTTVPFPITVSVDRLRLGQPG